MGQEISTLFDTLLSFEAEDLLQLPKDRVTDHRSPAGKPPPRAGKPLPADRFSLYPQHHDMEDTLWSTDWYAEGGRPHRYCIQVGIDAVDDRPIMLEELEEEPRRLRWLGPYNGSQRILLVGEGDFSFAASLAVAFGDASNMVATSLDSFGLLLENYSRAMDNILKLKSRGCKVMHGVDATKMASHPELRFLKFDRIVYNFPHAGFANRYESRDAQISEHQQLVRGFMANAKKMIKVDGQIHITHKCCNFFREWNLEMLGLLEGLRLVEEARFDFQDYPGYRTKRGDGSDDNFNSYPSKTYKFQLALPNKKKW